MMTSGREGEGQEKAEQGSRTKSDRGQDTRPVTAKGAGYGGV